MVVLVRENIMKRYVGNNLRIVLSENSDPLTFVGNNIRVKIKKNEGKINIVGDNCRVDVQSGAGKIKYTGNNGKFSFGEAETGREFEYNGSNVRVDFLKENPSSDQPDQHPGKGECRENRHEHRCNPGTNIVISNSKHVRINSTRIIRPHCSTPGDSNPI